MLHVFSANVVKLTVQKQKNNSYLGTEYSWKVFYLNLFRVPNLCSKFITFDLKFLNGLERSHS
jgi:hypothetical protein